MSEAAEPAICTIWSPDLHSWTRLCTARRIESEIIFFFHFPDSRESEKTWETVNELTNAYVLRQICIIALLVGSKSRPPFAEDSGNRAIFQIWKRFPHRTSVLFTEY